MQSVTEIFAALSVSRETEALLQAFADLVGRWNPKINLVSQGSLPDIMRRHIADSAQLFDIPNCPVNHWVDLGSGGGFPGVVLAILGADSGRIEKMSLVESDARKCVFLREAVRTLSLKVDVIHDRIENVPPLAADVVSARALAPLPVLLGHAYRHLAADGIAIFPKGARYQDELSQAECEWFFDAEARQSLTDPEARILVLRSISPKPAGRQ
jgi:16S rRNA (guanine527-N7)-methyltransferase